MTGKQLSRPSDHRETDFLQMVKACSLASTFSSRGVNDPIVGAEVELSWFRGFSVFVMVIVLLSR